MSEIAVARRITDTGAVPTGIFGSIGSAGPRRREPVTDFGRHLYFDSSEGIRMAVALQNLGPTERARHVRRMVDEIGLPPRRGLMTDAKGMPMTDRLEKMLAKENDPRVAEMIITAIALAGLKGDGDGLGALMRVHMAFSEIEGRFRGDQNWSDSIDGNREKFIAVFEKQLTLLIAIHQAIIELRGKGEDWGKLLDKLSSDLQGSLEARFDKIR